MRPADIRKDMVNQRPDIRSPRMDTGNELCKGVSQENV